MDRTRGHRRGSAANHRNTSRCRGGDRQIRKASLTTPSPLHGWLAGTCSSSALCTWLSIWSFKTLSTSATVFALAKRADAGGAGAAAEAPPAPRANPAPRATRALPAPPAPPAPPASGRGPPGRCRRGTAGSKPPASGSASESEPAPASPALGPACKKGLGNMSKT